MGILIELAVESLEGARTAAAGGAGRIELCADLAVGGLTPADELTRGVLDSVDLPVFAMIRPRAGDFIYAEGEIADMCRTASRLRALGVHGLVTGALTNAQEIDRAATAALVDSAGGVPVTFHRAFDRVVDTSAGLEQLVELGVTRVLTSGAAPTAFEGSDRLRALVSQSAGRITVLAGAGVRESNVRDLVLRTGVREVHTKLTDRASEQLTMARVQGFRRAVEAAERARASGQ
jgi:copper homeostasis protein